MGLFTSSKELEERIASLETELEAAQGKATRADELERELAELKAGHDAERNEWNAANAALENELTAAKAIVTQLEAEKLDLTEQAALTAEKVSLEAARQLAAAGHPPVENLKEDETADPYAGKSKDELQAIAHGLRNKPKEQSAFVSKYLRPLIGQK